MLRQFRIATAAIALLAAAGCGIKGPLVLPPAPAPPAATAPTAPAATTTTAPATTTTTTPGPDSAPAERKP